MLSFFVLDEPCVSHVWDLRSEVVVRAGGDWTTGVGKSGAASRCSATSWAEDLLTLLALDCKAVGSSVHCVSWQSCFQTRQRDRAPPRRRSRARPRKIVEVNLGGFSSKELMVSKIIGTAEDKVSFFRKRWERITKEIKTKNIVKNKTGWPENAQSKNVCQFENGRLAFMKKNAVKRNVWDSNWLGCWTAI